MKLALLGTALAGVLVVSAAPVGAAPTPVHRAAREAVVSPGSYLTVVERGRAAQYGGVIARSQSLVLVSATGETTTVYQQSVPRRTSGFRLLDWSTDGRTALLRSSSRKDWGLIAVDVATGTTQELVVPLLNTAILDPAGTGVLATAYTTRRSSKLVLDKVSWSGAVTLLRDSTNGSITAGRNGTVLTTDGEHSRIQVLLSTATGAVVNEFRIGGYCGPVRWWDATRVLETCQDGGLHLVDPTTGSTEQLTGSHGTGDYGHLDARYAGQRLYVQVAGGCGYTFVGRVTRNGTTKHLRVPGAVGNVVMVNAVGKDLVLEHTASCDGDRPRSELTLFDPVHHDETPLLVLGTHEDFGGIMVLGEVRASTF
jgi:hypothetical protein